MYRLYLVLCVLFLSCQDDTVLPNYSGATNEVVVVVDDHLWTEHCQVLRQALNAQVEGIAWQEPLFDVIQIAHKEFSSFFNTHRNLILVQQSSQSRVHFGAQTFSQQQFLCVVEYQNQNDLPLLLDQYAEIIAHAIQQKEKQRFFSSHLLPKALSSLKSKFNINLSLPSTFTLVTDTQDFSWYAFNPKDLELIKGVFIYEIY